MHRDPDGGACLRDAEQRAQVGHGVRAFTACDAAPGLDGVEEFAAAVTGGCDDADLPPVEEQPASASARTALPTPNSARPNLRMATPDMALVRETVAEPVRSGKSS